MPRKKLPRKPPARPLARQNPPPPPSDDPSWGRIPESLPRDWIPMRVAGDEIRATHALIGNRALCGE
jgi:hypothetical protein